MRIAALADVHGNLAAFEAAIAHARAQSPDQIVLLGDYSTGPDALAC
jgi:predicted phosphodiesterase